MENNDVIFECPIDPKIRVFLRYENVQRTIQRLMGFENLELEIIKNLQGLTSLVINSDLKNILLIALQNQSEALQKYRAGKTADQEKISRQLIALGEARQKVDAFCIFRKEHYLQEMVKRRSGVIADTCSFDLPVFHAWLLTNRHERERDIQNWYEPFRKLDAGVQCVLSLSRLSGLFRTVSAEKGFFSQLLTEKKPLTMFRLKMKKDAYFFPEFSAGKHQLNLYFMQVSSFDKQPRVSEKTVQFELARCTL